MGINLWSRFYCEAVTVAKVLSNVHYKVICRLKTGSMSNDTPRSEEVIEDYKKHKLAASALRRIHLLIQGFEQDRAANLRLAGIGLALILVIAGISAYILLSADSVTLP